MAARALGPVLAILFLTCATNGAIAEQPSLRAFENVVVRPIPGHTLACKLRWSVEEIVSGTDVEVVAITADGNGSRVRQLTTAENGLIIEVETQFDSRGAVQGLPKIKMEGDLQAGHEAMRISRAWNKYLGNPLYAGRPVSSGQRLASEMTRHEFQSVIDRFWQRPVAALSWSDIGRIAGMLDHTTFDEVIVVEWAAESALQSGPDVIALSLRVIEYYDPASGVLVAYHSAFRVSGMHGEASGKENYLCEYVARP